MNMRTFFQRKRLIEKGLACGKIRRGSKESALPSALRASWWVKSAILGAFAIGLGFLIFSGASAEPTKKFVISLLILATAVAQLWLNQPATLACNARLALVFGALFVQLAMVKAVLMQPEVGRISVQLAPLLVPYVFATLVLSVLMGKNHGLYAAVFSSLWGAFLVRSIDPVFLVISLITSFIAVYVTIQVRRRSRLMRAGIAVGLATWVLAVTFGQIGPIIWEAPETTNWMMIFWQSFSAIGIGILTAVVVGGILPALENVFGITTDISWLEMADLNHPLLKRMSLEAPGTYHHSLAVANLAEAAAESVGANPTICRVGAYFHDIGKLIKPEYFTENMRPGENPHVDLTPTMSSLIIIAHVKEGVELAIQHKLNNQLVDVIRQHHGTSLISCFYQLALRQQEDARLGGKIMNMRPEDVPGVCEESFRYPGPKPQSKETAIVSLADCVESASRSLERPTPQKIGDLVDDLIRDRIAAGELDECPLTLRDVRQIGETFKFTLMNMLHSRIAYPRREEKEISQIRREAKPAA